MTTRETIIQELDEIYGFGADFVERCSDLIDKLVKAINNEDDAEEDLWEELKECITDYAKECEIA